MRAFVFSLDAFVAFILALVAVYTLIFFSSVPSAYYFILTQAHYLSRDALLAAAQTDCSAIISGSCSGSVLDNVLEQQSTITSTFVKNSIGASIPVQFGYRLEKKSVEGGGWEVIYDTATATGNDLHAKTMKKLQVSTSIVNIGLVSERAKERAKEDPYVYNTCGAGVTVEPRLITCGDSDLLPPQEEGIVVPTKATIVRLTVFI